jgi:heme/copper-type cytochrome/quinol oxidase subunit 2
VTPSIFAPVSTPAFAIRELAFFVLGITGVIFLLVAGLTAYTLVRSERAPTGTTPAAGRRQTRRA